jgi:hypothetical protein
LTQSLNNQGGQTLNTVIKQDIPAEGSLACRSFLAKAALPMRPALWSVETAPWGALNSSEAPFYPKDNGLGNLRKPSKPKK